MDYSLVCLGGPVWVSSRVRWPEGCRRSYVLGRRKFNPLIVILKLGSRHEASFRCLANNVPNAANAVMCIDSPPQGDVGMLAVRESYE